LTPRLLDVLRRILLLRWRLLLRLLLVASPFEAVLLLRVLLLRCILLRLHRTHRRLRLLHRLLLVRRVLVLLLAAPAPSLSLRRVLLLRRILLRLHLLHRLLLRAHSRPIIAQRLLLHLRILLALHVFAHRRRRRPYLLLRPRIALLYLTRRCTPHHRRTLE